MLSIETIEEWIPKAKRAFLYAFPGCYSYYTTGMEHKREILTISVEIERGPGVVHITHLDIIRNYADIRTLNDAVGSISAKLARDLASIKLQ